MTACDACLLLAAFAVASDLPVAAALALQADPFGVDACCQDVYILQPQHRRTVLLLLAMHLQGVVHPPPVAHRRTCSNCRL